MEFGAGLAGGDRNEVEFTIALDKIGTTKDVAHRVDGYMRIRQFSLVLMLAIVAGVSCRSGRGENAGAKEDTTPAIVEINGAVEHKSAFDRFVKSRLSDFVSDDLQPQADKDQRYSSLLDEFIRRQVIVNEALKKNIVPTDDEIRSALEAQHKQTSTSSGAGGDDKTMSTLESGERRIEIINDLLMLKYYQTELLKNVKADPAEVENYYNANREKYQRQNGFYVREIRLRNEADAQKVYRQVLAKPDDFPVLAKQYSESPIATIGGLIYYEAQQLPQPLEQAITPLKVGQISKVIKSSYGYHIFKLEQRAEPQPLEKVRREIEDRLLSEKNQVLIDGFNKNVLAGAKIRIYRDRLGFNYVGSLNAN